MPDNEEAFTLIVDGEPSRRLVLRDDELHKVFSLMEHNSIEGPLEVFRNRQRVGMLTRSDFGLWEICWHAGDLRPQQ